MEIKIDHLSKIYKNGFTALQDINISLETGVIGLLGPNGAGKSTLIKTIVGLEKPSSGTIQYSSETDEHFNLNEHLGYVPQNFGLPENLTGKEFLNYMSAAKGLTIKEGAKRSNDLLGAFNLDTMMNKRISGYSGGMKQRLGIAQALLNTPQLLILDEPTVGLDPDERLNLRQIMTELAETTTVILSTHIVSDVESVANKIAIMNQGKVLMHGETDTLLDEISSLVWEITVGSKDYQAIQKEYLTSNSYRYHEGIKVRILTNQPPQNAIQVVPTLEEVYLFYSHQEKLTTDGKEIQIDEIMAR